MTEEKEYEIVEEGNAIVKRIKERYPNLFWPVVPDQVIVLGVSNKPRPFSMRKLAKITKIDAAHRTILRAYAKREIKYVIELYLSDWVQWNFPRKQWILAHEIAHIDDPESKSLVQHDIEDFGWILDAVGIDWWSKENLPDILDGDLYPFRQELFDRLRAKSSNDDVEAIEEGGDSHGSRRNNSPWEA